MELSTEQSSVIRREIFESATKSNSSRNHRKEKDDQDLQFVEFILGNEYFSINLFHTKEVINGTEITPLPGAPSYIRGVMDLRGSITTIIELKKFLHIPGDTDTIKRSRIIILDKRESEKPLGILVDDVFSVSMYAPSDIEKNEGENFNNRRHILGVIRKTFRDKDKEKHRLILWLDIEDISESVRQEL